MDDTTVPGGPDDDTTANRAASSRDATEGGDPTTIPAETAEQLQDRASKGNAQGGAGRPPDDE